MGKHTPGPWTYGTSNEGWTFDIYQADVAGYTKESSDVATLHARTVECDPKCVQEANARLIAAAPDLLQFAKEFLKDYQSEEGMASMKYYAKIAYEAITKATGEP